MYFLPSMVMPPLAASGIPSMSLQMGFDDLLPTPLALVPIALAAVLYGCLLYAKAATRRHEEARIERRTEVETAPQLAHQHAA